MVVADRTVNLPVVPVRLIDDGRAVRIIDQRRLPAELVERDLTTLDDVVDAIVTLAVRGAPAIGICAAMGLGVVMRAHANAHAHAKESREEFLRALAAHASRLVAARPTAVNLAWAVRRCVERVERTAGDTAALAAAVIDESLALRDEDLAMSTAIGVHGLTLLGDSPRLLTHCNTGALATSGLGTALAPIYAAHRAGRAVSVFATETRPLLQGARLTAWELQRAGVPVTVLVDSAAAALLQSGAIDAVLVGADRIAANGDVANKIGTYALAVAAARHRVPFYVLAPWSTVDAATPTGAAIPIEMRMDEEVTMFRGARTVPDGVAVWNPSFDVTAAELITAIVTDRGVQRPPYQFGSR